jgi:hypothetical protein
MNPRFGAGVGGLTPDNRVHVSSRLDALGYCLFLLARGNLDAPKNRYENEDRRMSALKEWFELLLPLVIFAGLFVLRYVSQFVRARRLKEIAPYINGVAVVWPFSPPRIRGTYMGVPFQMVFLPSGRNSPGRIQIKLSFEFPFSLEIRPPGTMQGLEQLFQRGRLIETGHEAFDQGAVARADKEREKAELYLDNPVNRESILKILEEGFESIRFTEKELVLTKQGDFLGEELTAERALHDLALAARLMQRL